MSTPLKFVKYKFLLVSLFFIMSSFKFCGSNERAMAVFVSPQGSDDNEGSQAHPFKTLARAVSEVAKRGKSSLRSYIYLRGGDYPIYRGIQIKDLPPGIVISAYAGEKVRITGGTLLDNKKVTPVSDQALLQRLSPKARGHIYTYDLKTAGILDWGSIRNRSYKSPKLPSQLEFFCDGEPLILARWPNRGYLSIDSVYRKENTQNKQTAVITYRASEEKSWAHRPDVWISGIFSTGWCSDDLSVKSIGDKNHQVELSSLSSSGIYSSTSAENEIIKASKNVRGFYFYNILEELDEPGEWYLDRETGKLYFWFDDMSTKPKLEVSITASDALIGIDNVTDLTIRNIEFSVTRGSLLTINASSNLLIDSCVFANTGLDAIRTSLCLHTTIRNSVFRNIGAIGVILNGGDRESLKPGNNSVINCEFDNFSRIYKSYNPAIQLNRVGNIVANCYIHRSSAQAVIFSGNDHVIENNLIQDVCKEFNDIGAIYTVRDPSSAGTIIRNNHFVDIGFDQRLVAAVYFDDGSGGMQVSNNLFFQCGTKSSDQGFGAVHINGGGYNLFKNNIFINTDVALSTTPWSDEAWAGMYITNEANRKGVNDVIEKNPVIYLKKYPWLAVFQGSKITPRDNVVENSLTINNKIFSFGGNFKIKNTIVVSKDINKDQIPDLSGIIPRNLAVKKEWQSFNKVKVGLKN